MSHIRHNGGGRGVSTVHSVRTHLSSYIVTPCTKIPGQVRIISYLHWLMALQTADYTPRIIKREYCSHSRNISLIPVFFPMSFYLPEGLSVTKEI